VDANEALKHAPNNSQVYLKKGIALFHLEEFESSKNAFEKGQSIESLDTFKTWIRKCNAEIQTENQNTTVMEINPPAQQKDNQPPVQPLEPKKEEKPKTTFRHDWYQSNTHVIVTLLAKNVRKEDTTIDITDETLDVSIKLPENNEYLLNLQLCDKISSAESVVNHYATKIEIKLKKASPLHWTSLEQSNSMLATRPIVENSTVIENPTKPPNYPSSNKKKTDWDEYERIISKDETLDTEDGLNKVFQDIYSGGSEEQRRAMMKSFVESGGTVLSTNWEDVGKRKVEGSAPKGMEMRSWNE